MSLRFKWDLAKAATNLAGHGVAFDEASTVFADPLSASFLDPRHSLGEERFVTVGLSHLGRVLIVMHTERRNPDESTDESDVVRIISARKTTRRERSAYEEGYQ